MNKLLTFAIMFLLTISFASAYSVVTGQVFDADTSTISGASVAVTCNSTTENTLTDGSGAYTVTFVNDVCPYNTLVHVVATHNSVVGSNSGYTCSSVEYCYGIPIALVDVTIPEFGIIAGAVALVGALGVFLYRRED